MSTRPSVFWRFHSTGERGHLTALWAVISLPLPHRKKRFLFFVALEALHVDGFEALYAVFHRGFGEVLACAEFFDDAGFFVFAFEFFQSAFDVFALFNRHDNHGNVVLVGLKNGCVKEIFGYSRTPRDVIWTTSRFGPTQTL